MEPFFTTRTKTQGTGLGLAMVYGLANQSGGAAAISLKVGEGTVVNFYFPATDDPERNSPAPRSSRGAWRARAGRG